MQDLQGLTITNFENKANIILGKAEVDSNGLGNFVELEEVTDFSIQSNITNIFQNTCAMSFSINLTNTKDKYSLYDKGASHYGYIKEGRKIRLYIGARLKPVSEIISENVNIFGDIADGDIWAWNGVYLEQQEKEIGDNITSDLITMWLGQFYDDSPYCEIARAFLFFDTSVIPAGAVITSAKLKLYMVTKHATVDYDVVIQSGMPDYPHNPFTVNDYNKNNYSGNGGSVNTADWAQGASTEIELTEQGLGWINIGGETKFILRSSRDIAAIPPTGDEEIVIASQNNTTEAYRPQLIIEYEIAGEDIFADYYWSWIYGIIDKPSMSYSESSEMCSITGRDYIAFLSETYLKKLWWGKNIKYNVVANQDKYAMPGDCTGIYRVFLDKTGTRTAFKEITLNSEYTYDWQTNELVFLIPSVPTENAAGCLWVYYHTAINVATLVADLLTEAGIMNASERYLWLLNTSLCTPTSKTIQRAWFDSGTSYITAINMLTEVATIYRFYINGEGNPCFKRIPLLSTTIKRIDDYEYLIKNTEERLDELYNHFIVIGEYREMKKMNLGVIAYTALYDLLTTSGELRGAILDNGGFTLTSRGFKWQATGGEEQDWHQHTSAIGYYTYEITGLTPDTEYKFCAYGTNTGGDKKQSPWVYFKTLPEEI